MPDRPAVRTVPNVELLTVGTWQAMTGEVTWTMDDLAAAVAAYDDPGYTTPVIKLGHIDPRFDGEPALGRIVNVRLSKDKQTLIGDLAGMPTWLADLVDGDGGANAYPRRSVEGTFNLKTATGTKHQFALTGLALLGVTFPALSTLADVATLYGLDPKEVAAAAVTPWKEPAMAATPYRKVGTSDAAWDGGAATKNCPNTAAALSALYAWKDPDGDPTAKATYKFPHHEVASDGTVGDANMKACSSAIGVLNGGRGGADIPDGDRAGVFSHLTKHLTDGGVAPEDLPELAEASADVAASVSLETVRTAFYSSPLLSTLGAFAWVREVYTDALIVDDDQGNLYRVPWSEAKDSPGSVEWGTPERVAVEYVPRPEEKPAAASAGALRAMLANMAPSGSTSAPRFGSHEGPASVTVRPSSPAGSAGSVLPQERSAGVHLTDEQITALRARLGLADTATDDEVLTALVAPPSEDGEPVAAGRRAQLPEGALVVDAATLANLQRQARQGEAAALRLARDDRDRAIQAAIDDGKIAGSRRGHYTQAWDSDPEGTREALANMPKNLFRHEPEGYTGDPSDEMDADFASLFPPEH